MHTRLRQGLWEYARAGDPTGAWALRDHPEFATVAIDGADELLILIACQRGGFPEETEAGLRTLPLDIVTAAHLHTALAAHALTGRASYAAHLYEEFETQVDVDDLCRLTLLVGFGLVGDHQEAKRWHARFASEFDDGNESRAVAAVIRAHAQPHALQDLITFDDTLDPDARSDFEVASELVLAYAAAGDPARAEQRLGAALSLGTPPGLRAVLIDACLRATSHTDPTAASRLLALAAMRDTHVDDGWQTRSDTQ